MYDCAVLGSGFYVHDGEKPVSKTVPLNKPAFFRIPDGRKVVALYYEGKVFKFQFLPSYFKEIKR